MANGPGIFGPYKHHRGGYRVIIRLEAHGPQGSRVFKGPGAEAEANAYVEAAKAEFSVKRRTIQDAIEDYRKDLTDRGLTPESVRQTIGRIRLIVGEISDSSLGLLTPSKAESLYRALATSGEYAPNTHHKALRDSKTFGAWIVKRKMIKTNPFDSVETIGKASAGGSSLRVNEARLFEAKAFEMADQGDTGAIAALIALYCDLRPGEIVQIVARDVDDNGRILWVDGARLKTANARRKVEVADRLIPYLLGLTEGKGPTDRILAHTRDYVADGAKRVCVAAGIPVMDARALRRTHATLASETGATSAFIAKAMGHGDSGKTAERHYIAPGAKQRGTAKRFLDTLNG